jgi:4-alpha-glucanotransferase
MQNKRSSGILLHPTSLPGNYGIGSLGKGAFGFVDFLHAAGQKLWQVLPLGHTGYGDSPYQCFSTFAGNPILIDLDLLAGEGLLDRNALNSLPAFDENRVDYGKVIGFKHKQLKTAYLRFSEQHEKPEAYQQFIENNEGWLEEYVLFMALKERYDGKPWWEWPEALMQHQQKAVEKAKTELANETGFYRFCQYHFCTQWHNLKQYANDKGISIIGDIPLYVAHDSADVWSDTKYFQFDSNRKPMKVAGVPPDYFSETGQLWGNPLYNWEYMKANGFTWWHKRMQASLEMFDLVRIDHFRGFEAYWAVPYGEETAINGEWVKAPGMELFDTLRKKMGDLPVIAEDLGIITPEVEALRNEFEFPGMKILQFAFHSDHGNEYLPHNYDRNFVVYTGTHDNDTLAGWYKNLEKPIKHKVLEYTDSYSKNVVKKLIRLAWSSVASMALIPLQDLLEAGSEARMNTPGTPSGNWQWRFTEEQLTEEHARWLARLTQIYSR